MKTLLPVLAAALLAGLASCSDDFLQKKRDYSKVGPEIYNDFTTAEQRVNSIYAFCRPDVKGDAGGVDAWRYVSTGNADDFAKCTEEFSGFGTMVDSEKDINVLTGTTQPYMFFGRTFNNVQTNPWGVIRMINDCIEGIEAGTLSQAEKDELLGQLHFFRAWRYFLLVKWFGGVPIIDYVLPVEPESTVARSTTAECIEFILGDLRAAADLLQDVSGNGQWLTGDKYGRVTTGTALALKGRVLTWWCSPLFNRKNDESRYKAAYEEMKADLARIEACGYALMPADGSDNYAGWADMFQTIDRNTEAVFLTRYNNVTNAGTDDVAFNNPWEHNIRPENTGGSGMAPSAMIVDMFPMSDGSVPNNSYFATTRLKKSTTAYDAEHPFLNRDPRFYRTFGFPGIKWPYSGNITSDDNRHPFGGDEYELWNYVWYNNADERDNPASTSLYGADNMLSNPKGIYVTKRSTGKEQLYPPVASGGSDAFARSYASYIELRYAEVLLNFAEVACGAGNWQEAVTYIQQIRARVGYTGDCGLNITNDASCMAAILYERQIEFAFEGKRFDDMRRWMLFDGGTQSVPGAPATWTLTGWNGDTCAWLGVSKFNGQHRDNMEFRVCNDINNGIGGTTWTAFDNMPDPIATSMKVVEGEGEDEKERTFTWNEFKTWRSQYAVDLNNSDSSELAAQLTNLQKFYDKHLVRKLKTSDVKSDNTTGVITFNPRYYFMGMHSGAQSNNPTLLQTLGWEDANGHNEYFDPLAD